jgi:hypothetical protein
MKSILTPTLSGKKKIRNRGTAAVAAATDEPE